MDFKEYGKNLNQILSNSKKMVKISWKMDRGLTFGYFFGAAFSSLMILASLFALKYLIDVLVINQRSGVVVTVPLIVVLILVARYVVYVIHDIVQFGLFRTYFDYLYRYKIQNELTLLFYSKLSNLDVEHLEDPQKQDLITKVRDTVAWRPPDYMRFFAYFFGDIVGYISAVILIAPYGFWIPAVLTLTTLPLMIFKIKFGNLQWSAYGSGAPGVRKIWYLTYLLAMPNALREMKIFQTQKSIIAKFKSIQNELFRINKAPLDRYLFFLPIGPVIQLFAVFMIAYYFLPNVLGGLMTVGTFVIFTSLLDQVNGSASAVVSNFGSIYEHNLYVNFFFQVLELPSSIKDDPEPVSFDPVKPPKIEFRNVTFDYPNGQKVLDDISFVIEPGESIAFVGINGAGKTTIIKLLCRFYDITRGEILINGVNIKKIKLSNWYAHMGTLFQDFVQYHFTAKENILLGSNDEEDLKKMKTAAFEAGASEFIEKLPQKYDQQLSREFEGGVELSGGQWQKLAIARAFYHGAPLLIMDEPTSAIDAEAEYEIFNNLEKIYKDKTLILVSHRFSTVRNANKIFVIENGKITEKGTHQELLSKKGKYARMFHIQAKGYQ